MPERKGWKWPRSRALQWVIAIAPASVLALIAGAIALRFWDPGPPSVVVITTGSEQGGYYGFGKRYADVLARSGVVLDVRTSAGSIQNLSRLDDPSSGVSVGLLQGGIGNRTIAPDLVSIGRVFDEPLWVFHRGPPLDRLISLKGKRIAIGPPGSGTRALALTLLKANGIDEHSATLSPLTMQTAVDAMARNEIDAVFLVVAPQAPLVQALLRDDGFTLMNFARADAYARRFPYLARLTLPQGVFDLVDNVPSTDITLVGPQAAIVVHKDIHPAIVALLAEAAQEVHSGPSLFSKAGAFPTSTDPEFAMHSDAVRYYRSGPTFWKRILPFWMANLAERLLILLVPILTVVIPLSKALPWLYQFRYRHRLHYWYKRLRAVEADVGNVTSGLDTSNLDEELDWLDHSVSQVPVPVQFVEQFYELRTHIDLVRARLKAKAVPATVAAAHEISP